MTRDSQTTSKTDTNGTTNYDWDTRGRLKKVTLPNSQIVNYSYDAFGRRTSTSTAGMTTSFLYDGEDVVLDSKSDGSLTDYINGPHVDEKLMQNSGGAELHFLADHLGSTAALTDQAGNIAERVQYEPFGGGPGSQLTRFGYTGRETDSQTGLMYYRARWYDPQQARFLTEDPIGPMGGTNLYSYVHNYPIGLSDPYGLQATAPARAPVPPPPAPIPRPVLVPGGAAAGAGAAGSAGVLTTGAVVVGGFAIGWGIGRGIGHIPIGSGRTVDDAVQDFFLDNLWGRPASPPAPTPRAKAEPDAEAKPKPVPQERGSGKWTCLVRCPIEMMKDASCDCPPFVEGIGHGATEADAVYWGEIAAKATFRAIAAGRKLNCRTKHCHKIWCRKR